MLYFASTSLEHKYNKVNPPKTVETYAIILPCLIS